MGSEYLKSPHDENLTPSIYDNQQGSILVLTLQCLTKQKFRYEKNYQLI